MTHEEQILICAVRYALGRMSYIVDVVAEYVALKQPELSKECINIIIRDIKRGLGIYHDMWQTSCMGCDEMTWLRLLEKLKTDI